MDVHSRDRQALVSALLHDGQLGGIGFEHLVVPHDQGQAAQSEPCASVPVFRHLEHSFIGCQPQVCDLNQE